MALVVIAPHPLAAQSILSGRVAGTVTSAADGSPLARVLVTLESLEGGGSVETTTDAVGSFAFGSVRPGAYELRAEALGYRPVLARTLSVSGGTRRSVSLELNAAPGPVLSVDTVAFAAAAATRWRPGGLQIGGDDLDALPFRYDDLSDGAVLATQLDASLGSQGLPGSMSLVVADGVPVYRATHPLLVGEHLPVAAFSRPAVAGLTVFQDAPDVEWAGSAGGYIALTTPTGTNRGGLEIEGAWSGGPLWSSSELDLAAPSLTSFRGTASATIPVTPETARIVVVAEGMQQETPRAPRVSEPLAGALAGLEPSVLASLTETSVERVSRYSGMARLDARRGATGRFFVRGAAAYSERDFSELGPPGLVYGAGLAEEAVDFSAVVGGGGELRPGLVFEVRGGVSGSKREFGPAGPPSAFLAGNASALGAAAGGAGESARTDVTLMPLVRWQVGSGELKAGMTVRASKHTMSHGGAETADFIFSDAASLLAGQGFGRSTTAPEESFTTREIGGFAQYDFEPEPGVHVTLGGRVDVELLPGSGVAPNTDWLRASGLRNESYPTTLAQAGGRAALSWDPANDGSTLFLATGSVHSGDVDPGALYQLFAQDVGATTTRLAGAGLDWPTGTLPAAAQELPALTLLGPDTRAPRSLRATVGLVRELGFGVSVHVSGAFRRTDFLLRRRNLNLTAFPSASDPYGRDVFGVLEQDGSLVTGTDPVARRFPAFGEVWALDPDGWSRYAGVTVGLEHRSRRAHLYASYTRSRTEDNWVGAAAGSTGAQLSPLLPEGDDWTTGTSDFDVPHRVAASATLRFGPAAVSALYHFRSGRPFTPGYRRGVDANGDGSVENDVAYVPTADELVAVLPEWSCLSDQAGRFAERNSCRGPVKHSLAVRLRVGLGRLGGREASLVLDAFNLLEGGGGVVDDALLLVDPSESLTTSPDGTTVTVPTLLNPDFGEVLFPTTRGRMLRIGFRIG